jgi:hypothetical protein
MRSRPMRSKRVNRSLRYSKREEWPIHLPNGHRPVLATQLDTSVRQMMSFHLYSCLPQVIIKQRRSHIDPVWWSKQTSKDLSLRKHCIFSFQKREQYFFLKLARICVLFRKLWWKFLTWESHFSTLSRSFHSKVTPDGTKSGLQSLFAKKVPRNDSLPWYATQIVLTAKRCYKSASLSLVLVCSQLASGLEALPWYASRTLPEYAWSHTNIFENLQYSDLPAQYMW